jgi:propanol-preferring alcohol dehydrogenase
LLLFNITNQLLLILRATFKMKAAIVNTHKGKFSIETRAIPVPLDSDILVKIHASGCCHTDVHAIDGDWPIKSNLPLCPGHEGAGIVVALGPNAKSHKIGDRVGIAWLHDSCGLW